MKAEPVRKIPLSPVDRIIERCCLTLLCLNLIVAVIAYCYLPERIPIHLNGGAASDEGGKLYIFLPICLSAFFYLLLTAIGRYAHILNPWNHVVQEDRRLDYYRRSVNIMRYIKLAVIISFTISLLETMRLSLTPSGGLSQGSVIAEGILIGLPAMFVLYVLIKLLFTKN